MKHLGDFDTSTVVYGKFTTFRPSTGAAFTLGGTPALSVYKDNSTTQSTSGVTLTADFDSVTGLNHFAIDTSTDGTFYSAGSFFDIVITTGTVDSVSVVGSVVASFTIRKNSALKPATAGRTLVVDAAGLADANTVKVGPSGSGTAQTARDIGASVLLSSGTGAGQISLSSGLVSLSGTQTFNVTGNITGNLSGSVGSVTGAVGSVTGAVGSVTGNVGGNVSGSVGSVVGAVGSVTGNVGGNVSGSVGSVVAAVAITSNIKQNQALSGFTFLMTDDTNHAPMTGATVAVTRSIDGGAFGAGTLSAVSEVGNGVYSVNFGAADLNGKTIILRATATGADDTFERIVTQV